VNGFYLYTIHYNKMFIQGCDGFSGEGTPVLNERSRFLWHLLDLTTSTDPTDWNAVYTWSSNKCNDWL